MTPMARASALRLGQERPGTRPSSGLRQCSTTFGRSFDSAIQPATSVSDGIRRTMSGRAATTSWNVIARFAALRLRQLGRRVDPGRLEQIGVLGADALDAHQVDVVDPFEDELAADARRLLERLATSRCWRPTGAALRSSTTPGRGELAACVGADALDVFDLHGRSSSGVGPALARARPDDTLARRHARPPPRPRRTDGQGVPRRDGRRLRADRAGPRPRQPDGRRRARQRRARPGRAQHAQPPRPDRRRDRDGQDQDAPADGRPAVEGRRARSSWPTSRAT